MTTRKCRALIDILSQVPDFRKAKGKRHPLSAILALACVAMMCGYKSYSAIAQWGRNYGNGFAKRLGFTHDKTPCASTLHTIFRYLSIESLEKQLAVWVNEVIACFPHSNDTIEAIAMDGKTLKGSQKQKAKITHLLSAVSHQLGLTCLQQQVDTKTNEIPISVKMLESLVLEGKVVTTDALLTQKSLCRNLIRCGADYVMPVKDNHPQLVADISLLFDCPDGFEDTFTTHQTVDKAHGRIEIRKITASDALREYTHWPGLKQVFVIERQRIVISTGEISQQTTYGITSLGKHQVTAKQLLALNRHHWTIENRSHWVRDVTFDEDRSQVRCGNIPQVMAAIRNTTIGLIRWAGFSNVAAATRYFAARPTQALGLLGIDVVKTE